MRVTGTLNDAGYTGSTMPPNIRPVVQAALLASAAVVIIALPAVTGHGRSSELPSALPRDYPRGLLIILGCIWAAATAAMLFRAVRERRPDTDEDMSRSPQ